MKTRSLRDLRCSFLFWRHEVVPFPRTGQSLSFERAVLLQIDLVLHNHQTSGRDRVLLRAVLRTCIDWTLGISIRDVQFRAVGRYIQRRLQISIRQKHKIRRL